MDGSQTSTQGCRAFCHFYDVYGRVLERLVVPARWYYSALVLHADMLFTSDRGQDAQPGAALRALRDLERPDLMASLQGPSAEVATATGRTLAETIKRIRNEVLVHHSFDLEQQGSALLFLGEPDDRAGVAFTHLRKAVEHVLEEIRREKLRLVADLVLTGNVSGAFEGIDSAPERARQAERTRRRAQRTAGRRRGGR